jgi:hypothetical protein
MYTTFYLTNCKGRYLVRELGVGGKIILKLILIKQVVRVWTALCWPSVGSSARFL